MAEAILDSVEGMYDRLGLMTGNYAQAKRAIVGGLATGIVLTTIKPSMFFDEKTGTAKPWKLLNPDDPSAVYFSWQVVVLLGAFVSGVLV